MVYDIRPQKAETHRVKLTVGGDQISYLLVSTPISDLTTSKILVDSILSTQKAKGLCVDIKDVYLNIEMIIFEYMKFRAYVISEEIME